MLRDGALRYHGDAVHVGRAHLQDAVPVEARALPVPEVVIHVHHELVVSTHLHETNITTYIWYNNTTVKSAYKEPAYKELVLFSNFY